jgi:hypothetical protein
MKLPKIDNNENENDDNNEISNEEKSNNWNFFMIIFINI